MKKYVKVGRGRKSFFVNKVGGRGRGMVIRKGEGRVER